MDWIDKTWINKKWRDKTWINKKWRDKTWINTTWSDKTWINKTVMKHGLKRRFYGSVHFGVVVVD